MCYLKHGHKFFRTDLEWLEEGEILGGLDGIENEIEGLIKEQIQNESGNKEEEALMMFEKEYGINLKQYRSVGEKMKAEIMASPNKCDRMAREKNMFSDGELLNMERNTQVEACDNSSFDHEAEWVVTVAHLRMEPKEK
ncbi:aspartate carbamoyltransferase catalytic subunit [Sesbania bispinosa]|nr:aspartate carbamoyltransferase catalytic subunit [Sesbania bispinosa]